MDIEVLSLIEQFKKLHISDDKLATKRKSSESDQIVQRKKRRTIENAKYESGKEDTKIDYSKNDR